MAPGETLSGARCTDVRLYTLRIKYMYQNNERSRTLALLNSPLFTQSATSRAQERSLHITRKNKLEV